MESQIGGRVKQYREFKGLRQNAFCEVAGMRQQTLSTIESGSSEPSTPVLTKILSAFPDLNPDWLLLGTGPMLRDGRALTPATPAPAVAQEPEPKAPTPGLVSGPATVAEAENILLRERIADKDIIIEMLRAELGKSNDSPDAADYFPMPQPRKPVGFGAAIQAALLASYRVREEAVAELS